MQEKKRLLEQNDSVQESNHEEIRVNNGGRIIGTEGGLRTDIFDHDENSEYDFSDTECPVCELPEHAQNLILDDIEYEEGHG
tara:strand:+ start:810 stop:1055 length:246 start_codon:yes stop_codon:yes gene_type:complete